MSPSLTKTLMTPFFSVTQRSIIPSSSRHSAREMRTGTVPKTVTEESSHRAPGSDVELALVRDFAETNHDSHQTLYREIAVSDWSHLQPERQKGGGSDPENIPRDRLTFLTAQSPHVSSQRSGLAVSWRPVFVEGHAVAVLGGQTG